MANWDRREFLRTGATGGAALAAGCQHISAPHPNILLVITDQQHIDTISSLGCEYARTPALDYLASRGACFANSYSADPVCSPARSAIFTGRTASETGVADNGRHIRQGIPNLGEWFRSQSDYETIYAGKWHLPGSYQSDIEGFRVLPGGIGGQGNVGDTCVSRACEAYLRNRAGSRPFLLTASFLQPHDICEWLRLNMMDPGEPRYRELIDELPPLPDNFGYEPIEPQSIRNRRQGNEPYIGNWTPEHWRYYRWSYYRHIEMVDAEIGRVIEALEDTGKLDETVILFTADHGEGLGHHQMVRKSTAYDESCRVPFIISWPGHFPDRLHDTRSLVSGVDITPTLCECAGLKPPPDVRGRSLRPMLEGRPGYSGGYVISEIPVNVGRVVRTERYKYVTFADDTVEQLFDLSEDPGETRNLALDSTRAAALADHKKILTDWEDRLDPAPNLPHSGAWWRSG